MNAIPKLCIIIAAASVFTGCATTGSPEPTTQASSKENVLASLLLGGRLTEADVNVVATKAQKYALGSERNPVRVHRPQGQIDYLSRLNCLDGAQPQFTRAGNFGPGPYGSIIDGYELTCSGDLQEGLVYMDMYHPQYQENEPVPGYTID